jgi:hypothetical protein
MKQHIGTKLSIGLLAAILAIGSTRAVVRAITSEAETRRALAAAAHSRY